MQPGRLPKTAGLGSGELTHLRNGITRQQQQRMGWILWGLAIAQNHRQWRYQWQDQWCVSVARLGQAIAENCNQIDVFRPGIRNYFFWNLFDLVCMLKT